MKPTKEQVEVARSFVERSGFPRTWNVDDLEPRLADLLAARDARVRAEAFDEIRIESNCRREHGGEWADLEKYLSVKATSERARAERARAEEER